jgi:transcriptional regulator with XRE-family HTH domain
MQSLPRPTLKNIVCEFITLKRIELNISQEYMATILDMNQSSYSKREKGYSEFTLSQIERVAKEFGMTLPEFFLKAFCKDGNIKEVLSGYIKNLNPEDANRMKQRLKIEYIQNSNVLLSVLLLLENFTPA